MNKFLNDKFDPKPTVSTVEKDVLYVKLPYVGQLSSEIKKKLRILLRYAYPQVNFRFVFTNSFTVGSILRDKSILPKDLCANVVYCFTCAHCDMRYVGSTTRWIKHRYLEHKGLSLRTGFPLQKPSYSAIRAHSDERDHPFTYQDFKILTSASNRIDLAISESLLIKKLNPLINNNMSSFQLSLD